MPRSKTTDGWSELNVGGFSVFIHDTWHQIPGPQLAYGCDAARVDFVTIRDGSIVDPKRLSEVAQGIRESVEGVGEVSGKLVRIQGRPTAKISAPIGSAKLLEYVIGGHPVEDGGGVVYPETQVVYVFSEDWVRRADELGEVYQEEDLGRFLEPAALSPEGHLEFGPIPIPKGWVMDQEDEEPVPLPVSDDQDFSEVGVGGGYILLRPDAPSTRTRILFQPTILEPATQVGNDGDLAVRTGKRLSQQFPSMRVEFATVSAKPFVNAPVCSYLLSSKEIMRRGFIWRDVLGYSWELVFILEINDWQFMRKTPPFSELLNS